MVLSNGAVTGSAGRVPRVVVVGAGPVGLTAALLLARRGVRVLVLERHPAPYPLPRAVHADGEVVRILQEAGVAEGFRAISRPMPGLRLLDARHRTIAEFRRDTRPGRHGHPAASMFDQPDLERLLLAALVERPEITLIRDATVTGVERRLGGATVRYVDGAGDRHEVAADAVLGCDGAESTVRATLGVPMRELGHSERWLVVDVTAPAPLPVWPGINQVCDPRRPTTFLWVTGTRYRAEFRIADGETAADLTTPPTPVALLAPWTGALPVERLEVLRQAEYVFRSRVARRWRDGRVLLLGDAAHQTPPFIGQGLGAGLRDAHNLAWKLDLVLRGAAADTLLDTYQAERLPHAVRTIRAAVAAGWALTGGAAAARGATGARGAAVRALCRLPGAPTVMSTAATPRLRGGPLIDRRTPGSPAGTMIPQPGGRFDDVLGRGYAVVTIASPGRATPGGGAGVRQVRVTAGSVLGRWLRRRGLRAVLVRPDRVVCAVARTGAGAARLARRAPAAPVVGATGSSTARSH